MVGMPREQSLNSLPISGQSLVQRVEHRRQCCGQQTVRPDRCRAPHELVSASEYFHSAFVSFGPVEFLGMEEFFPCPLAGTGQCLWSGKPFYKGPSRRQRPVVERLQGGGKIGA